MWLRLYKPVLAGCAFLWLVAGATAERAVPSATDLQRDGREASDRQLPIVLEFSAATCTYCAELERDFLVPMLISGEYTDRIILRRLLLDGGTTVTDFDGRQVAPGALADRYHARFTPTLVFLDSHGRELAERIIGINTPELFGGYLDACIDTALLKIRDPDSTRIFAGCAAADSSP
jgi:thioredoxin-related protein